MQVKAIYNNSLIKTAQHSYHLKKNESEYIF